MISKKLILCVSILAALAMVSAVHAVEPIPTAGITCTASSTYPGTVSAMQLVNGSGLSGVYPNEVHAIEW